MRLVDGDALLEEIQSWSVIINNPKMLSREDTLHIVENAPTITPESLVRHGRWIRTNNPGYSPFDGSSPYIYFCDQCHAEEKSARKFCPECGCKMDLEEVVPR